jgi:hypothetical protein
MLFLLVSSNTFAQSVPTSLFACLNGNGNLYGVTPTGKLGEGCSAGDLPVSLGSAGTVNASNGLVGSITNGVVDIGVAEGLAIPPACPPGQIPISDGNAAWICTLPGLTGNPNPGAKVWVIPETTLAYSGLSDRLIFVNPGLQSARTICYYFTGNGSLARPFTTENIVPSGGRAECNTFSRPGRDTRPGIYADAHLWMVLVSDLPLLPTAHSHTGIAIRGHRLYQIQAFPIDCRHPEGYEFVCEYAID